MHGIDGEYPAGCQNGKIFVQDWVQRSLLSWNIFCIFSCDFFVCSTVILRLALTKLLVCYLRYKTCPLPSSWVRYFLYCISVILISSFFIVPLFLYKGMIIFNLAEVKCVEVDSAVRVNADFFLSYNFYQFLIKNRKESCFLVSVNLWTMISKINYFSAIRILRITETGTLNFFILA